MADCRQLDLEAGPDWRLSVLEKAFIATTMLLPLAITMAWQDWALYWLVWLALLALHVLFDTIRPQYQRMSVEPDGTVTLKDNNGKVHHGLLGAGVWLADSWCVVPVTLDVRRSARLLGGRVRVVIARRKNDPEPYREFRVWARLRRWG